MIEEAQTTASRTGRIAAGLALLLTLGGSLGGCTWDEVAATVYRTTESFCRHNPDDCGPGSSNPYDGESRDYIRGTES